MSTEERQVSRTVRFEQEAPGGGQKIHRLEWNPTSRTSRRALFRLFDADTAVLQHVRGVTLRQRGQTTSFLDPDATLNQIPDRLLASLRAKGYSLQQKPIDD